MWFCKTSQTFVRNWTQAQLSPASNNSRDEGNALATARIFDGGQSRITVRAA
jgi:hypothetical protein